MPDAAKAQEMLFKRWTALKTERESWMGHWMELSQFFAPRAGTFVDPSGNEAHLASTGATRATNRGIKKHTHIYDNTPLRSVDVLAAGLVAGMTSPARPWFRLRTPDEQLNERHRVRAWLHTVEQILRNMFAQSNTYRAFRRIYEDLGVFGTAASIMLPDFQDGIRFYPLSLGEFALDMNAREEVNTLYRSFDMTVGQIVDRFGLENVSQRTKGLYDRGQLHHWLPVVHAIEPRRERDPLKLDNRNMPWKSCYFELDQKQSGMFLRQSGFRRFPGIAPRWKTNGHDVYGEAPAMRALGDAMQLQQEQYRKAQAIDYQTQPPLQVSANMAEAVAKGPGGVTIVDAIGPNQGIRSAWDVNLNLQYLLSDILDVRQRVAQALFEDMFLLFTTTRKGVQPPTAEEIVAQQEEKLLMVGPVLENLHNEQLAPTIEGAFEIALEGGLLPPPPPEMSGQPLLIQFVSTLAQAQKLIGLSNLDRMIGTIANLASIKPSALDKLNGDEVVNAYADALGVDPDLIVADDQVALIRQQKAQEMARDKLTAALPEVAKSAKDLSQAGAGGSAAVQALNSLGGVP